MLNPLTPSTQSASTSPQTLIRLENITKSYQRGHLEVHALHPLNLEFYHGQFVAIMGKSGSGKSTLLNLLGMLDQPTSGNYWLQTQNVAHLHDDEISHIRCRKIGFIFQSFNLFSQLSILENVCVPLRYAEAPHQEMTERAELLLEKVGLADRLHHRPNELSGGQCQRVAIARALANNPAVILADEPTGNLDEKTGNEVLDIFHSLRAESRTILMVTHNPEYRSIVDRTIDLHDGKILTP